MNWHVRKNGIRLGVFSEEEIRRDISLNRYTSMDEVSVDGRAWQRIRETSLWTPLAPPPPHPKQQHPKIITAARLHKRRFELGKPTPPPVSPQQRESLIPKFQIPSQRVELETVQKENANRETYSFSLPTYAEERAAQQHNGKSAPPLPDAFSFWHLLFGGVFRRHRKSELADILSPTQTEMRTPRPTWLWSRVLLWVVVLSILCLILAASNSNMLPGYLLMAAFGVPVTVLVFFLECDVSRRVSAWAALGIFLLGGIFSLLLTEVFNGMDWAQSLYDNMEAAGAGPVEEPAKALLLLPFLLSHRDRRPYITNGLLLGAAIGAGFAAFETAGYCFNSFFDGLVNSESYEGGIGFLADVAFLRGCLAPFMHIAWTGTIGGALWYGFGASDVLGISVVKRRILAIVFCLVPILFHTLWNAGAAGTTLGQLAWLPLAYFLKKGHAQLWHNTLDSLPETP